MIKSGQQNITERIYEMAEVHPGKDAFLHPRKISFKEFVREIDRYAEGFRNRGIDAGSRTIVLLSPGAELFAVSVALFRIGAIPVMIDPGMGIRRMVKALEQVRAEAFVGISRAHLLRWVYPRAFRSIRTWISSGPGWSVKTYSLMKMPYVPEPSEACTLDKDQVAALFFTSGSTGSPKGVIYTVKMLEAQLGILKHRFGYTRDEIDLCTFPLVGLLLICMGISLVLADMDMTHPARLIPRRVVQNIQDHSCTHMFCSPMVLKRLAAYGKQEKISLESLKWIMTAGAPVLPSVLADFRELLARDAEIHTPYGATEALPLTSISDRELLQIYSESDIHREGLCVGYPMDGTELRILAISEKPVPVFEDARFLKTGEVGEILVCGANVSEAYWEDKVSNDLAKVYEQVSRKIWHRTGDLGKMDSEGRLWYFGRKSQRVAGKDKVYFTIPVEAVFNQHPAVSRSALVGVANGAGSYKIPVIWIEAVKNKKRKIYLQEELRNLASEYEVSDGIKHFLFLRKFPVDPRHNAKIFREKLAERAKDKLKL